MRIVPGWPLLDLLTRGEALVSYVESIPLGSALGAYDWRLTVALRRGAPVVESMTWPYMVPLGIVPLEAWKEATPMKRISGASMGLLYAGLLERG